MLVLLFFPQGNLLSVYIDKVLDLKPPSSGLCVLFYVILYVYCIYRMCLPCHVKYVCEHLSYFSMYSTLLFYCYTKLANNIRKVVAIMPKNQSFC